MASFPIYDKTGAEVGNFEIDLDAIAPHVSRQLLHDAVVMYQANQRQGSAKTKTRTEVAGAKQKMYRQKGTGRARAGHRRSGVRRGGGHIFAKRPRNWYYRLPRKALQAATRMAIISKFREENVMLIDELAMASPKTKDFAAILAALKLQKDTLLIAVENYCVNTYKSARNIQGVRIMPVAELNAYEILRPRRVLMTKAALESFVARNTGMKNASGAAAGSGE